MNSIMIFASLLLLISCFSTEAAIARQSRSDTPHSFRSLSETNNEGSSQLNILNQGGRLLIPLGNFQNPQTNSFSSNSLNNGSSLPLTLSQPGGPENNPVVVPSSNRNTIDMAIGASLQNQFSGLPNGQTLQPVQQSFMVDNRPIVSVAPPVAGSVTTEATSFQGFNLDATSNNQRPIMANFFQPPPDSQLPNGNSQNGFNNFQTNPASGNSLPSGSLVPGLRVPENVGTSPNNFLSVPAVNWQNPPAPNNSPPIPAINWQNPQGTNKDSSFRLPEINGPSSFRPQGVEISPFGKFVIPMGDSFSQPISPSGNSELNKPLQSTGRDQVNSPETFSNNQIQNQPQNSLINNQGNPLNQSPQPTFLTNNMHAQEQGLSNFQISQPLNSITQPFPPRQSNVEDRPQLISETGFRPVFGGVPSIPRVAEEEDVRDQVIKIIDPGSFKRFNKTRNHSATQIPPQSTILNEKINVSTVIQPSTVTVLPTMPSFDKNLLEPKSNPEIIRIAGTSNLPITETTKEIKTIPTSHTIAEVKTRSTIPVNIQPSVNGHITEAPPTTPSTTSSSRISVIGSTTEAPSILLSSTSSHSGGRACKVGNKTYEDSSHVDVGNPCILCSCMDSGLWCIPNNNCPDPNSQYNKTVTHN